MSFILRIWYEWFSVHTMLRSWVEFETLIISRGKRKFENTQLHVAASGVLKCETVVVSRSLNVKLNVHPRRKDAEFKGFARSTVAKGAVVVKWICVADCCEGTWDFLDISGSRGLRMTPAKILEIFLLFMVMYIDGADVIEERGSYILLFLNWKDFYEKSRYYDREIFSKKMKLLNVCRQMLGEYQLYSKWLRINR